MHVTIFIKPPVPATQREEIENAVGKALSARIVGGGMWIDDGGNESDLTVAVPDGQPIGEIIDGCREVIELFSLDTPTSVRLQAADLTFSLVA